ncbi:acyltransferase [Cobetia crustatorum]|uniref:acyltransferase n=1 Tax=Cobetia crustatorum TaxID=553385 RepID=UPI00200B498D|nr:acyltransferase [Cobetia crustatorum]
MAQLVIDLNFINLIGRLYSFLCRKFYIILYIMKGLRVKNSLYLGRRIRFNNVDAITILDAVSLGDNIRIWGEIKSENSRLIIGRNVQVNRDTLLDITGRLELKDNVFISEGCMLYTHTHGHDPRSVPVSTTLVIEENVWIGTNVIILPSVNYIGARSIIGAGTVVSKNIPPDVTVVSQSSRILSKAD